MVIILIKLQQVLSFLITFSIFLLFSSLADPATSGPTITPPTMLQGEEKQYQIGDILSLNCTSGRSQPRSILTFYINDEAVSIKSLIYWHCKENKLKMNYVKFLIICTSWNKLSFLLILPQKYNFRNEMVEYLAIKHMDVVIC